MDKTYKNLSVEVDQSSNLETLRIISIVVVFFRVGAPLTNINIGSSLINQKGYQKT